MQSSRIPIIMFLLTILYYPTQSEDDHGHRHVVLEVGYRHPDSRSLLNVTEHFSNWETPAPLYIVKTYSVHSSQILRMKITTKHFKKFAHAGIVTGRVGDSFISIGYSLAFASQYDFKVELYGRYIK